MMTISSVAACLCILLAPVPPIDPVDVGTKDLKATVVVTTATTVIFAEWPDNKLISTDVRGLPETRVAMSRVNNYVGKQTESYSFGDCRVSGRHVLQFNIYNAYTLAELVQNVTCAVPLKPDGLQCTSKMIIDIKYYPIHEHSDQQICIDQANKRQIELRIIHRVQTLRDVYLPLGGSSLVMNRAGISGISDDIDGCVRWRSGE